jgi:hypothetical protein
VADFNDDGMPDIATSNAVLLGKGDGSFQNRPRVLPGSPEEEDFRIFYATPSSPAAADLDGDAHVDLVGFEGNNSEGTTTGGFRGKGDFSTEPFLLLVSISGRR